VGTGTLKEIDMDDGKKLIRFKHQIESFDFEFVMYEGTPLAYCYSAAIVFLDDMLKRINANAQAFQEASKPKEDVNESPKDEEVSDGSK